MNTAQNIASDDPESLEEARQRVIEQVMTEHQVVSSAWSMIDGPFAQQHAIADHQIALDEFRALIGRVVHLPQSVEGIRFLEHWFDHRMTQLDQLKEAAVAGNSVCWRTPDGEVSEPVELSEDVAKGIRIALAVVGDLFAKFPLQMTAADPPEGS
ncbi:hypothetical protein [Pseudomonas atacamensis]|uniref:hypothetical protein n=1 Tax=Pseudomonas atacamensis TaxID=2565368 RepID=UPI0019D2F4BE|nr:hypothetical protein [Pseudomonas atacamensis]QSL90517.1 hypothetical protein JWU58_27145 [Pseudomonas atacamensis]